MRLYPDKVRMHLRGTFCAFAAGSIIAWPCRDAIRAWSYRTFVDGSRDALTLVSPRDAFGWYLHLSLIGGFLFAIVHELWALHRRN